MKAMMVGMLAETPVHSGSGQSMGAIDLPVQREATTNYPIIVGSSVKGSMRDAVEKTELKTRVDELFGIAETAGKVGVTDARLLLLPVRTLHQAYLWVTCPYALEKFYRDLLLLGLHEQSYWQGLQIADHEVMTAGGETGQAIYLEEYVYTQVNPNAYWDRILETLKPLMHHEQARLRLPQQLAIISNAEFHHFAEYGLTVRARNQLNDDKKSQNLWYEESLPPDTLLYFMVISRFHDDKAVADIGEWLVRHPYLQVGGNESVGQGWCILQQYSGGVA
ncbi:MAG: type III-B CRISPR module RAMP protein Cmr4 [Sulfobacillus thermosulfidooxidans]|nr:MAG: type III-B CRISPR module RAMP protein Cmr4 [Sulfobacillus thermosulfidooxidans]